MKIIAVGTVTAGGKISIVDELSKKLNKAKSLHFKEYIDCAFFIDTP